MKKYFAVALVLALLVNSCVPRPAHAWVQFVEPAIQCVLVGLGVEVGIEATTELGKQVIAQRMWEEIPQRMKDKVTDAVTYAVAGKAMMDLTHDDVQDLINARDTVVGELDEGMEYTIEGQEGEATHIATNGSNWVSSALPHVNSGLVHATAVLYRHYNSGNSAKIMLSNSVGSTKDYLQVDYFQDFKVTWVINRNNSTYATGTIYASNTAPNPSTIDMAMDLSDGEATCFVNGNIVGQFVPTATYDCLGAVMAISLGSNGYVDYSMTGADQAVVLEEDTDFAKIAGLVDALLSQNAQLMDLVGRSLEIDTETGVITPPATVTNDDAGIISRLTSILTGVNQGFANIITKVQAMQLAITNSVGALTAAPSVSLTFEPIRTIGTGFSSVFPFSLPWDLNRILGSFNATEWNGEIPISAHSVLANFDFVISFAWFDNIRGIVKGLEVVCFDIGLIFITRKILGGAA